MLLSLCHSFLWLNAKVWNTWCIYNPPSLSIHLLMGHLGCFHVLATVNSATVNTGVHASFQLLFSRHISRNGIARSYCNYFQLFKETPHYFHSGCTSLHFHQQCRRVLFSPYPLQHLLLVDSRMAILSRVSGYSIVEFFRFFVFLPRSMAHRTSQTRDRTHAPCSGSTVLT